MQISHVLLMQRILLAISVPIRMSISMTVAVPVHADHRLCIFVSGATAQLLLEFGDLSGWHPCPFLGEHLVHFGWQSVTAVNDCLHE
jgi:hypothetical protein